MSADCLPSSSTMLTYQQASFYWLLKTILKAFLRFELSLNNSLSVDFAVVSIFFICSSSIICLGLPSLSKVESYLGTLLKYAIYV
jgi:hypothetical protein